MVAPTRYHNLSVKGGLLFPRRGEGSEPELLQPLHRSATRKYNKSNIPMFVQTRLVRYDAW